MSQVSDTGRLVVDSSASTGAALAEPGPTVEIAGESHTATWRTWTIELLPGHYRATDDAVELRHTPKPDRSDRGLHLNMVFGAIGIVLLLVALALDIWG